MLPRSPYSSQKVIHKPKAIESRVKLPQIHQKSLSPAGNLKSSRQEYLLPSVENYYDDFYKIFNRNNFIRENWISAHQKLIKIETQTKLRKSSLPPAKKTEI
jgi:hypothetical protein